MDFYILTQRGREFVSFDAERKALAQEKRMANWKEWPKKYWQWFALFSFIFGSLFGPIASEWLERKFLPESSKTEVSIKTDSSYNPH